MNEQPKQGFPTFGLIFVLLLVTLGVGFYYFMDSMLDDYSRFQAYKNFCEERPNLCYCSLWESGCEFKTSWSSVNGLSNDTKELCELAKVLKDKKTLFRVGCGK